jgi:hypothetical protein
MPLCTLSRSLIVCLVVIQTVDVSKPPLSGMEFLILPRMVWVASKTIVTALVNVLCWIAPVEAYRE